MDTELKQSLQSRYDSLDAERSAVLSRARECSKLTIPALIPPEGSDDNSTYDTPYQGLGAIGVNNLSSKLLLTLLPPNQPFFKLAVDDFTLAEFTDQKRAEAEKALNKIERTIFNEVETKAIRVPTFTALKHLVVGGNVATYQPEEGGMKVFRIDQYVVNRDSMGNLLEIIVKENISPLVLPEDIRDKVLAKVVDSDDEDSNKKEEELTLYSRVKLSEDGKQWEHIQEVNGEVIEGSEGTYKLGENPYSALRWSHVVGSNYGRGFVEEYLGDLKTLEALSKAITEDAVIASRTVFMVNPAGVTRAKKFKDAKNGDVIDGNPEDIGTAKVDRQMDLQLILERISALEQRLSRAFLMLQSIQRNAERVTAEEIKRLARELENSLGGVYSILTQEFQLPLVKKLMVQMTKQKKIPKLPEEVTTPKIVTGLDGLGRGNDLQKLMSYADVGQIFPEQFSKVTNFHDFFTRVATALGFDTQGLIKDAETMENEKTEGQTQGMLQQAMPELTKAMMNQEGAQGSQGQGGTGVQGGPQQ